MPGPLWGTRSIRLPLGQCRSSGRGQGETPVGCRPSDLIVRTQNTKQAWNILKKSSSVRWGDSNTELSIASCHYFVMAKTHTFSQIHISLPVPNFQVLSVSVARLWHVLKPHLGKLILTWRALAPSCQTRLETFLFLSIYVYMCMYTRVFYFVCVCIYIYMNYLYVPVHIQTSYLVIQNAVSKVR